MNECMLCRERVYPYIHFESSKSSEPLRSYKYNGTSYDSKVQIQWNYEVIIVTKGQIQWNLDYNSNVPLYTFSYQYFFDVYKLTLFLLPYLSGSINTSYNPYQNPIYTTYIEPVSLIRTLSNTYLFDHHTLIRTIPTLPYIEPVSLLYSHYSKSGKYLIFTGSLHNTVCIIHQQNLYQYSLVYYNSLTFISISLLCICISLRLTKVRFRG